MTPDIEDPELIGKVSSLEEAWKLVAKQFEIPVDEEGLPSWENFDVSPKREEGKGYQHTRFEISKEEKELINTKDPIWIAVNERNTYFAYPGNWYEREFPDPLEGIDRD